MIRSGVHCQRCEPVHRSHRVEFTRHDTPEINRIADLIVENLRGYVQRALALDVDAVTFGDGAHNSLLELLPLGRKLFRQFHGDLFPFPKALRLVTDGGDVFHDDLDVAATCLFQCVVQELAGQARPPVVFG